MLARDTVMGLTRDDSAPPGQPGQPSNPAKPLLELATEALAKDPLIQQLSAQPLDLTPLRTSVDTQRAQPAVSILYQADAPDHPLQMVVHCLRMRHSRGGELWQIEAWKPENSIPHQH